MISTFLSPSKLANTSIGLGVAWMGIVACIGITGINANLLVHEMMRKNEIGLDT